MNLSRRSILFFLGILFVLWVLFAYREAHRVELRYQEISLARLPGEFDGFRILLLADLHLNNDSVLTERLRDRIRAAGQADLVLIAGDFKDFFADERAAMGQLIKLVPELEAFPRLYVVNGNHDTPRMIREVESLGIRVLRNEREILKRGEATLGIAGVSYPLERAGIDRAVRRFRDDHGRTIPDCQILLAHTPDVILREEARQADLVLAGHTHGGQIALPLIGAVTTLNRLGRRYAAGLFSFGSTQLFVTRGVGTTFVPLRFLAPPEIVLITLRRK